MTLVAVILQVHHLWFTTLDHILQWLKRIVWNIYFTLPPAILMCHTRLTGKCDTLRLDNFTCRFIWHFHWSHLFDSHLSHFSNSTACHIYLTQSLVIIDFQILVTRQLVIFIWHTLNSLNCYNQLTLSQSFVYLLLLLFTTWTNVILYFYKFVLMY